MPRASPGADKALARALRRLREERGLSQEDLALRSSLSPGSLARIELAQSSPAWATVREIGRALDVSIVELANAVDAVEASDRAACG
jgi:transcriptional regulator with XRE-family HTH domain